MTRMLGTFTLIFAFSLFAPAHGQVTHNITVGPMGTLVFDPADIVIDVGDSVLWTWESVAIIHNVVSGELGIQDGHFFSGAPMTAPFCFEVTFLKEG